MTSEDLRFFCAIVREMNITRAAEGLHISQQALSKRVAALEKEYGAVFFERIPRLRLTTAGKLFHDHCLKMLSQEKLIRKQLDEVRTCRRGELTVGVTPTRSQTYLPRFLPRFTEQNRNIRLNVQLHPYAELRKKLCDGALDLILCLKQEELLPPLQTKTLMTDQICLALPRKFLLRNNAPQELLTSPLAESLERWQPWLETSGVLDQVPYVLGGPHIRAFARKFFLKHVPDPKILLELSNTETLFALPFCESGATFLFRSMIQPITAQSAAKEPSFTAFPLSGPDAFVPLILAFREDEADSWALQKFIAAAEDVS